MEFSDYYEAVNGRKPFAWQVRMADEVVERGWPHSIDVPTGFGKTSVVDVFVYSLFINPVSSPRRLVYVVDRRIVVNQVYEVASLTERKISQAEDGPLLDVKKALLVLGGRRFDPEKKSHDPCAISSFEIRGGKKRDQSWAECPLVPSIICSTVEQAGSALLFRSYGCGKNTAPIHAGIMGNDVLFVVDEAHISIPFVRMLEDVEKLRAQSSTVQPLPFGIVRMSATLRSEGGKVFSFSEDDLVEKTVQDRYLARKPARLIEVAGTSRRSERDKNMALASAAVRECVGRLPASPCVMAIILNRVEAAKEASRALEGRPGVRTVLVTGRMRPFDKDRVLAEYKDVLSPGGRGGRAGMGEHLIVVSTQCVEVGADFDFDFIVTECASLDALAQRFGRTNRVGEGDQSLESVILKVDRGWDPVYGMSGDEAWNALKVLAAGSEFVDLGTKPFRVMSSDPKLPRSGRGSPFSPIAASTVFTWAAADKAVQTSPRPGSDVDVSLLLHGQGGVADVQVLWRSDVPELQYESGMDREILERLSACRPSSPEATPVRIGQLRSFLLRDGGLPDDTGDATDVIPEDGERQKARPPTKGVSGVRFVLWTGPDDSVVTSEVGDIKPGMTVVLPTEARGWDVLSCTRSPDEDVDIGDVVRTCMYSDPVLRISRSVYGDELGGRLESAVLAARRKAEGPVVSRQDRDSIVEELMSSDLGWRMKEVVASFPKGRRPVCRVHADGVILRFRGWERETAEPGEEARERIGSGLRSLAGHLKGVRSFARSLSARLPHAERRAVEAAAAVHDAGKADSRFQHVLYGRKPDSKLVAKSDGLFRTWAQNDKIGKNSGLPKGYRHELDSLRVLHGSWERISRLLDVNCDQELVKVLTMTHHGRCRPLAPFVDDPSPPIMVVPMSLFGGQETDFAELGEEPDGVVGPGWVPGMFWRAVRKHGRWGLAYLEAIVRIADHMDSKQGADDDEE